MNANFNNGQDNLNKKTGWVSGADGTAADEAEEISARYTRWAEARIWIQRSCNSELRRNRVMMFGINRIDAKDGRLQSSVFDERPFLWHFRVELRLIRFLSSCHPHLSSLPGGTEANSALCGAFQRSIAAWIGSIGHRSNFRFYNVTPGTWKMFPRDPYVKFVLGWR